jgi:hypothetical protein
VRDDIVDRIIVSLHGIPKSEKCQRPGGEASQDLEMGEKGSRKGHLSERTGAAFDVGFVCVGRSVLVKFDESDRQMVLAK